ncbi:MAG: hypothetical protein Q7R75_02130 [bacterium]|nr:hypothetical protein [bacterium]
MNQFINNQNKYGTRDWRSTPGNFGSGMKRPVKTFQDLDVYQQSLEANVFVVNFLVSLFYKNAAKKRTKNSDFEIKETIIKTLFICSSTIPHQIAEAHSFRFGSQKECLILLEKVMLNCNKMVVYLDQTRDICKIELEAEKFGELQKKYFLIRRKVLNLQRVWQKYMEHPAACLPGRQADVVRPSGSQSSQRPDQNF